MTIFHPDDVGFFDQLLKCGHRNRKLVIVGIMVDDDRLPLEPGEAPQIRSVRFRTLGCYPLSGAVESEAATLTDIIAEMKSARTSERQGRLIDTDEDASMEKKKREGYF